MTELATPPVESTGITRISHWIGGRSVAGTSGRSGPVYNPATGRQTGAVDFATVEEVDAAVQAAKAGVRRRGARSRSRSAPSSSSRIRELVHERREEVAKILTARARQGALGRARRGDARARGDRVLLRPADAPQERVLRAGVDRHRRLLDPAAARRRRRDHAVQLPGDGAHVDVGAGDRVPATRSCSSRRRRIRRRRSGRPSC